MVKVLRSLIHEVFPTELRVKIDLLSRRRDIVNDEKHQEILHLLREYHINDITQLGPGTNRYAIKINGFVVKFATDNDGKIDNFKEFKMTKRLQPYVSQIYEVASNGTILVAEYIEPFTTFSEMLGYADQIRDILRELSASYLIGDVGITSKNCTNWGLRTGTKTPVCLDFAYVYAVTSDLFICRNCKHGSMLRPNSDFTDLFCPTCNAKYTFEDIRAMIGNDIHNHEIGDLTQEGYLLYESKVETELTEERSNYLKKRNKKNKKKDSQDEEVSPNNEYIENTQGGIDMSIYEGAKLVTNSIRGQHGDSMLILPVKAVAVNKNDAAPKDCIPVEAVVAEATAVNTKPEIEEEQEKVPDSQVAFVWDMSKQNVDIPIIKATAVIAEPKKEEVKQEKPVPAPVKEEVKETVVVKPEVPVQKVEMTIETEEPAPVVEAPVPVEMVGHVSKDFLKDENITRAVSLVSNFVGDSMMAIDIYGAIRSHFKRPATSEDTYKAIRSTMFKTITQYCGFTDVVVPNSSGTGNHHEFYPPADVLGTKFEPTMIFIGRLWDNPDILDLRRSRHNNEYLINTMSRYCEKFSDYQGIQREMINTFRNKLKSRIQLDVVGLDIIVKAVTENWFVSEAGARAKTEPQKVEVKEEPQEEVQQEAVETPVVVEPPTEESLEETTEEAPVEEAFEEVEEPAKVPDNTIAFTAPITEDAHRHHDEEDSDDSEDDEEDEEECECEDDEDDGDDSILVQLFQDDDVTAIHLTATSPFGPMMVPFYVDLDKIDMNRPRPAVNDDRNGMWDWLCGLLPEFMFKTNNPDRWLRLNNEVGMIPDTILTKFVILEDLDDGTFLMGAFQVDGIYETIDSDGNYDLIRDQDLLDKIIRVLEDEFILSKMSYLNRNIHASSGNVEIMDEAYAEMVVAQELDQLEKDSEFFDDTVVVSSEDPQPAGENAALSVLLGGNGPKINPGPVQDVEFTEVPDSNGNRPVLGNIAVRKTKN